MITSKTAKTAVVFALALSVLLIVGLIRFLGGHSASGTRTPHGDGNQAALAESAPRDQQITAASAPIGRNLLLNPLLATATPTDPALPLHWESIAWGEHSTQFSYLNSGSSGDNHSVEIQITNYTNGSSEWLPAPVAINDDRQYTFSDEYRTNIASEVDASFYMPNGSITYEILGFPAPSTSWKSFATTFSVPLGAQSVSVYQYISGVGYLITDNYSLVPYTPVGFTHPLVTLTFDDGYASTYRYGLPLLRHYHLTSTQFIITDTIGENGYVTRGEIRSLYADGNEIASHTVTHDNLTLETPAELKAEMRPSQLSLQSIIGAPVTDMAYPYGLYNPSVVRATKAVYSAARGVEDGLNSKDAFNRFDLKVQDIYSTTTTAQIAHWLALARSTRTWLILVFHSVDSDTKSSVDGGIYNVTPRQLQADLAIIEHMGLSVTTMRQAIREITPQLPR